MGGRTAICTGAAGSLAVEVASTPSKVQLRCEEALVTLIHSFLNSY